MKQILWTAGVLGTISMDADSNNLPKNWQCGPPKVPLDLHLAGPDFGTFNFDRYGRDVFPLQFLQYIRPGTGPAI